MAIIGRTGSGKTTLANKLLEYRKYKVMFVTKPDDLTWRGWRTVHSVKGINPRRSESFRLYPPYERQALEFFNAVEMAWRDTSWCVYVDEAYQLEHVGLRDSLIKLLTQGRSQRITTVLGVQRPAWVTRFALSEPTHVFSFQLGDKRDLKALADGVSEEYAGVVGKLEKYQFAYYNKSTMRLRTGNARTLDEVLE